MPPERSAEGGGSATRRNVRSLAALQLRAADCRDCPLWKEATQTVFGEGTRTAWLMLVGEQPGNREDREGKPFVGPAGALLDRALAEAGIERSQAYVTNAVKHFKFRQRGKRRIHERPSAEEAAICRQWLDGEIELVGPRVLVCLGLTAAHALLGHGLSIGRDRGRLLDSDLAPAVMLTTHPAAVLRERDDEARHAALEELVADLRTAAKAAALS